MTDVSTILFDLDPWQREMVAAVLDARDQGCTSIIISVPKQSGRGAMVRALREIDDNP